MNKICHHCQIYGKSPGRLRFHLRDDIEFNAVIIADIFYITENGKAQPVLHILDEATRFQNGEFLEKETSQEVWEKLRMCWIDAYVGPPDTIVTDAGKNFTSKELQYSAGRIEDLPHLSKRACLKMAFKAINDTAGPKGLVPTLLVLGAYSKISNLDAPAVSVEQRAKEYEKAMEDVRKLRAERQVKDALSMRNGPITSTIRDPPLQTQVLVWREGGIGKKGSWQGPYNLLGIDGNTCIIQMQQNNNKPSLFRITSAKPYYQSAQIETSDEDRALHESKDPIQSTSQEEKIYQTTRTQQKRSAGRPNRYAIYCQNEPVYETFISNDLPRDGFKTSRKIECRGLVDRMVTSFVNKDQIPPGTHVYNAKFIDSIKNKESEEWFEKSRLCIAAWGDEDKWTVLTQSTTIQRASQRSILAIAPMMMAKGCFIYDRDVEQAFTQPKTPINRPFYFRAPVELCQEMGISVGSIVMLNLPLYRAPESGNHWFNTYHKHHTKNLGLSKSAYDPCLFIRNDDEYFGVIGMQIDDTFGLTNTKFAELEEEKIKVANIKSVQVINPNMDDAKALNKALQWQIENPKRGLTFIKIEEDFEVSVFVDSSFANNKDYTSQLGTIIAIKDKTRHINIIHFNSIKAKRVVRSVLNAELQGLLLGFDMGVCIKKT
ncbi:hypothetical protein EV44_g3790 [Erysiphe necator]|uniref:Integrase catalytic domain-containing protein n=1 Tax=Uncinula necator TaxID=52586 RepID=A0A0B1P7I7_UNCNE|nr:hypothetical protein EV44_g3790 [Erysiphe necator]